MFISRQYFSTYSFIVGIPVPFKSKPANPNQKEIAIDQIIHLPQKKKGGGFSSLLAKTEQKLMPSSLHLRISNLKFDKNLLALKLKN